jgi:hypothetical protein
MGVTTNQAKRVQNRPSRTNVHKEDRKFIFNFLDKLPKLPWHYCRKATNNLYLEKTFKTVSDVSDLYKNQCEESSLKNMSLTSFMKAVEYVKFMLSHTHMRTCTLNKLVVHQHSHVNHFALPNTFPDLRTSKAIDEKNITCLQINLYLEQPMEVQLFATFLQRRK